MPEKDTLDKANTFVNQREKDNLKRLEQTMIAEFNHSGGCGCANCKRLIEKVVVDYAKEANRMRNFVPDEEEDRLKKL